MPCTIGCNISTFLAILIRATLLRNPAALDILWVQGVSVLAMSLLLMAFFYVRYQELALAGLLWLNRRWLRTLAFVVLILALPLFLFWP